MCLNLSHKVHDYNYYDEQGCSAEIELNIPSNHHELGDQTDKGNV